MADNCQKELEETIEFLKEAYGVDERYIYGYYNEVEPELYRNLSEKALLFKAGMNRIM